MDSPPVPLRLVKSEDAPEWLVRCWMDGTRTSTLDHEPWDGTMDDAVLVVQRAV